MTKAALAALVCVTALAWQFSAVAKDKPAKNKGEKNGAADLDAGAKKNSDDRAQPEDKSVASKSSEARGHIKDGLTVDEQTVIRNYVRGYDKPKNLPPGLAKKVARGRDLPPGWQKKCVPGEVMPLPVFERCQPLPPELVIKLPPSPVGTVTVAIGGKVVRVIKATREILDVFDVHVRLRGQPSRIS